VINKALAKRPEDRYRTAGEFRDALDMPITAAFDLALRSPRKSRKRLVILAAAVAAFAAIAAAIYARATL